MDATFHAGERALQDRAGVGARLAEIGPVVVRDHMPEQHRELFGKLPTLLVAVQDADGQPWATMLHGPAGFVSSPDAGTLRVGARPLRDDPVAPWLVPGAAIGLLGLEAHTRRRNRANGRIRTLHDDGFAVDVLQSFGNCPKYIHARRSEPLAAREAAAMPAEHAQALGPRLDAASLELLGRADTMFIASASGAAVGQAPGEGLDVSHRGGRPGFIAIDRDDRGVRLTIPDYIGNFFFNTLGNLRVWPLAGLLVPDYEGSGTLLHLAARASLTFEGPRLAAFPGAQRLLHLEVLGAIRRPGALPLRWSPSVAPPQFAH